MRFSIRHADRIVGSFILLALVFLVALLFLLGSNQRWFAKNYYYTSRFPSANSINVGTGISFKGFEIGKISKVNLNKDDLVDVEFYVYDTFADRVRENSVLELSVSPIGLGTSLLFHKGKGAAVLAEKSFVPSLDTDEGRHLLEAELVEIPKKDDTITRLLANVNQVMEGVNRTLTHLNLAIEGKDGGGELAEILGGIKSAVKTLDGTLKDAWTAVGNIGNGTTTLLGNTDTMVKGLQSSLPKLMAQLDDIMANLQGTTSAFKDPTGIVPKLLGAQGSIPTFLNDGGQLWDGIKGILDNITQTTRDLQKTMEGISGEIPRLSGLLLETKRVLEQTQDVMEGLKNNPLLKGGIPQKPVQESRLNSIRGEEF